MLDLIIKNANVYDGSGSPAQKMDVCVQNGKIVSVGKTNGGRAVTEIDASGLTLTPGFIDVHAHSELQLLADPSRWCKLKQGVTTEIGGQCGWSLAPFPETAPKEWIDYINKNAQPFLNTYAEAVSLLNTLKFGANQACFIGHLYLRGAVAGLEDRPVSAKELETMCAMMEEGMQSGAFGLSSGLVYAPGIYSSEHELTEIAKVVGRYGGRYTTHIRNEGDNLIEAVQEALRIGEAAGVPVNISHLKALFPENYGKIDTVLEMIDKANTHGANVTFDVYPYTACSATITSTLPPSYMSHGRAWLMEHLEGKENIEALRKAIYEPTETWENPVGKVGIQCQLIASAPKTPEAVGLRLSEYAKLRGVDDITAYADLIRLNEARVTDIRFLMSEENVEKLYSHPVCMVGSDGLYRGDRSIQHVRAFATFIRYLSHYIRDRHVLSMEEGIHRLTGMPADLYGLEGKGHIAVGCDADFVLLDLDKLAEKATYANPFIPNEGIHMVFVNGRAAVVDNELTGVMDGKVILRKQARP